MSKPLRLVIVILAILIAVSMAIYLLLRSPPAESVYADGLSIENRQPAEVTSVLVANGHGEYIVTKLAAGYDVDGLPPHLINMEYLGMLLDECSNIYADEVVSDAAGDLARYGLDAPRATVEIAYSDGGVRALSLGGEEPVSKGLYLSVNGDERIFLLGRPRSIRFLMEVEKYLNFIVTPPNSFPSALAAIENVTFSGKSIPQPIVIREVKSSDAQAMLAASSFGVSTHLIYEPRLHELDQGYGAEIFQSLMGVMYERVVEYGCTGERLLELGFGEPDLVVEYDARPEKGAQTIHVSLRLVNADGGMLMIKDDDNVVYFILREPFTNVKYEKLCLRWFFTPFITDLESLVVRAGSREYVFAFSGNDNASLEVSCGGKKLPLDLFRKYYRLIVGAENDGRPTDPAATPGKELLTVEYHYKADKTPDVMRLFEGEVRRALVEANGAVEFAMNRTYCDAVMAATRSLLDGKDFSDQW